MVVFYGMIYSNFQITLENNSYTEMNLKYVFASVMNLVCFIVCFVCVRRDHWRKKVFDKVRHNILFYHKWYQIRRQHLEFQLVYKTCVGKVKHQWKCMKVSSNEFVFLYYIEKSSREKHITRKGTNNIRCALWHSHSRLTTLSSVYWNMSKRRENRKVEHSVIQKILNQNFPRGCRCATIH